MIVATLELPPAPRSPWQRFYAATLGWRRRHLGRRQRRLPVPVVSVGNLHFGGTGKTPLVEAVARHLNARGRRVAILSRGYGRKSRGPQVVSTGDGPCMGPEQAGDEPFLLATALPGVAVVVGARRFDAGRLALDLVEPDLLLLDDGFSHVRLARDLDLLTFPVTDPFSRGRLLPAGGLREPLAAVRHADAVVLTGVSALGAAPTGADLAGCLRRVGFRGPGFSAALRTAPRSPASLRLPSRPRVVLVSGIAAPERLRESAAQSGLEVVKHLAFHDHHRYPERSLRRIAAAVSSGDAHAVLTTGKDRVKLAGRLDVPIIELAAEACPEPAFWCWLDRRLESGYSTSKRGSPPSTA